MPAKRTNGSHRSLADVDAALPRTFFVMRGHVRDAFGLTREEMNALVMNRTFVAKYPVAGGKARFIRTQVLQVAREWEAKQ